MDLFVINRHGDEQSAITEEEEKNKLERLLKQIERKKQHRIKQRKRQKQQRLEKKFSRKGNANQNDDTLNTTAEISTLKKKDQEEKAETKTENEETFSQENSTKRDVSLENFTVLGAGANVKKSKAERVLPHWLANPTVISSNLQDLHTKVSKLHLLDKSLRTQLKSNGITYFFPIQAGVIPWLIESRKHADIMCPRDVCVSAPTGSGKTLAFVLPVVQALKKYTVRKVRALVMLPTQDLAEQVFKTFQLYTKDSNVEVGLVSGKHLYTAENIMHYSEAFGPISKVDILVCTAGRLVKHLKSTKGFNLQSLEFLIIDEADRVLENAQADWLYHLEKHIFSFIDNTATKILNLLSMQKQRSPQKLLFSATLTQDPEKLKKLSLFQPKLFTCMAEIPKKINEEKAIPKFAMPEKLVEKYIVCSKDLKPLILYKFIKQEELTKTLVFIHSVDSAHRLKILLLSLCKKKLKIEEISSRLKGGSRDTLIADFSSGLIDVLICTDSLARGIDLPGVRCVISYSAPKFLRTYIHRAGRTARAGESGLTVTLLHKEQVNYFKLLKSQLGQDKIEELELDEEDLESLGKKYQKALHKLKETVEEEEIGKKNLLMKRKKLNFKTALEKKDEKI